MKSFAYFCLGVCALCVGASFQIFSIKYQPPKPSALDEMQDAITKNFTEAFESEINKEKE